MEANFKETELTHVRVGQKATVVLAIDTSLSMEATDVAPSPTSSVDIARRISFPSFDVASVGARLRHMIAAP